MVVTVTCERGRGQTQKLGRDGRPAETRHVADTELLPSGWSWSPEADAIQGARPRCAQGLGAEARLPAPPPALTHSSPATQATDVAVRRPPGGWKLPPRLVLDQEDRDDAALPDATPGTRCLSRPSERTRRSPSLLLGGGEPTLGA